MVDMNTCKPGDKLRSKHGLILTYVEKSPITTIFPHIIEYPDGSMGSRTDDGYNFSNPEKRLDADHDIVEIIPKKEKALKLGKKTKVIPTMTIICVWEVINGCSQVPTAFYGNDEKKVVKAAEEHFADLLKKSQPDIAEGSTFEDILKECLSNGFYDTENGYEIVLSWPSRKLVE